MNSDVKDIEEMKNDEGKIIIETVEVTIAEPKAGTIVKCSDPDGFDQTPIPQIIPKSDRYFVDRKTLNGIEREEAYYQDYATLVFYPDVKMEAGKKYTVFARMKAADGYVFSDPVNMIVNGEELSSLDTEDYTLEGDGFCFYCDLTVKE